MKTFKEVEDALDRLFTEWKVCGSFDEEDIVEEKMGRVFAAWFIDFNIPATIEGKLRKKNKALHEKGGKDLPDYLIEIEFAKALDEMGWTKPQRARTVYSVSQTYPQVNTSKLCLAYGISSGYFRELRQIYLTEWKAHHAQREDFSFYEMMFNANNPDLAEAEWKNSYGNGFPREIFKLKLLTAASTIQPETPTKPEENQATATNNTSNQTLKASL